MDTVALLSVRRLTDTVHWQVHAYKVLDDLDELLSFLQDAETGQRGFLLTGEEHYLDPYRASVAGVREDFLELRALAATQHDLTRAVEQGRFRSDLLYRIRVGRVRLPPLHHRREDIPLLVGRRYGERQHRLLDPSAIGRLRAGGPWHMECSCGKPGT